MQCHHVPVKQRLKYYVCRQPRPSRQRWGVTRLGRDIWQCTETMMMPAVRWQMTVMTVPSTPYSPVCEAIWRDGSEWEMPGTSLELWSYVSSMQPVYCSSILCRSLSSSLTLTIWMFRFRYDSTADEDEDDDYASSRRRSARPLSGKIFCGE